MYQEVCFNRGTEAGGGVNVGHSLSSPSHFMLATGLGFVWIGPKSITYFCKYSNLCDWEALFTISALHRL